MQIAGRRRRFPVAVYAALASMAWVTLGDSRVARAQDAPLPPPLPLPVSGVPEVGPQVPSVLVHVDAARPVTLQALAADATHWRAICVSPCDADVPLEGLFRVVAPGIQASRETELEAAPGDRVVLDVNVRTNAEHDTARRLTIAGYVAGAVGLGLEIGALAAPANGDAEPVLLWAGVGAAAAAVTFTIMSYVMGQPSGISQSHETPVIVSPRRTATAGSARAPVWHVALEGPTLPPVTTIPLLTTSF